MANVEEYFLQIDLARLKQFLAGHALRVEAVEAIDGYVEQVKSVLVPRKDFADIGTRNGAGVSMTVVECQDKRMYRLRCSG